MGSSIVMSLIPAVMRENFLEKQHIIADSHMMSSFLPGEHKKYDAKYYYKQAHKTAGKLVRMESAPRSEVGRRAYDDFTASLQALGQAPPVAAVHCGTGCEVGEAGEEVNGGAKTPKDLLVLAQLERLLANRRATATGDWFSRRLWARAKGFLHQGKPEDPLKNPSCGRPALREATVRMLEKQPEAEFDQGMAISMSISASLYAFTLLNQLLGVMYAKDGRLLRNRWLDMSQTDTLWTIFVLKEAFFLTLPLLYLLFATLALAAVVGGPVLVAFHFTVLAKDDKKKKVFYLGLKRNVGPAVLDQLYVLSTLPLSVSTTWRLSCIIKQLMDRKANKSVKDFADALTNVSNMMYTLALLLVGGDVAGLGPSLCLSTFSLLRMLTAQQLLLSQVCDGLKDVNENKLSKFEFALILTKICDQML
eukprot:CAMPEP_0114163706 /NCGR_PEP_ID=MMETSP0043_2-20121206/30238_1 /TAXON_ID=464988 /ORGANISM="Hemiselmis andersenii, Strain CCMP644" /LENGTH=419 /DNA_ID=CAMNT_0001260239 /DNA_START=144 /DNA_END=1400 /DNA_ORIENTATION=+